MLQQWSSSLEDSLSDLHLLLLGLNFLRLHRVLFPSLLQSPHPLEQCKGERRDSAVGPVAHLMVKTRTVRATCPPLDSRPVGIPPVVFDDLHQLLRGFWANADRVYSMPLLSLSRFPASPVLCHLCPRILQHLCLTHWFHLYKVQT